jgi:inhibitor of nuclear factor kappa-B kinase subunit alpha
VYQENVLQGAVKPLNTTVFSGQKWIFQQDSAPAHKAKMTRVVAEAHSDIYQHRGLDLRESRPQPPELWAVLEDMACRKHPNNLGSLKRSLVKAAAEIPLEKVRASTDEWLEHLKACVEAEGGHFE